MSDIAGRNDQVNYTITTTNQNCGNNLVGTRGSVVAISEHVVFSGDIGQTYTIIEAPMASNMMVNSDKTTLTNQQGVVLVVTSCLRLSLISINPTIANT